MEQTNQNQFKCSGDCLACRMNPNERRTQWQYCAAQFSYNALRTMQTMQETITLMSGEIKELKDKVDAIQNNEAMVFAPDNDVSEGCNGGCNGTNADTLEQIAQEGDGAAQ